MLHVRHWTIALFCLVHCQELKWKDLETLNSLQELPVAFRALSTESHSTQT